MISPSACIEWWCTSSASVLKRHSDVTKTCGKKMVNDVYGTEMQDVVHKYKNSMYKNKFVIYKLLHNAK